MMTCSAHCIVASTAGMPQPSLPIGSPVLLLSSTLPVLDSAAVVLLLVALVDVVVAVVEVLAFVVDDDVVGSSVADTSPESPHAITSDRARPSLRMRAW